MVVGSALSLIDVDNAVQVGEVAIQVDSLGVAAAHKPVLNLPGLQDTRVNGQSFNKMEGKKLTSDCCPIT